MAAKAQVVNIQSKKKSSGLQKNANKLKKEIELFAQAFESDGNHGFSAMENNFSDPILSQTVASLNERRAEIFTNLESITANVIQTVKSMTDSSKTIHQIQNQTTQLADYSSTIASAGEELSATINSISLNLQNIR